MDGFSSKAAVLLGSLAIPNVWVVGAVLGGLVLVRVLTVGFGFWVVAFCAKDRQAVGVKVLSLLVRQSASPPKP